MLEVEDDPEWLTADTLEEDDDSSRYHTYSHSQNLFNQFLNWSGQ